MSFIVLKRISLFSSHRIQRYCLFLNLIACKNSFHEHWDQFCPLFYSYEFTHIIVIGLGVMLPEFAKQIKYKKELKEGHEEKRETKDEKNIFIHRPSDTKSHV